MMVSIVGALAAAYCTFWLAFGLIKGRLPDNLARMIDRDNEKFTPMLVAYGIGLLISVTILVLGMR